MTYLEKPWPVLIGIVLAVGLAACRTAGPSRATLAPGDSGYFKFPTTMKWQGRRVDIGGTLTFPDGAAGPVPVVVLVHSGDGVDYSERQWENLYLGEGYAVFMLDYMAPRSVTGNSRKWPRSGMDVYDALKVLATHPRIDSMRIAVQGFSNGGTVAASSVSILSGRDDVPKPRAFIMTYGGCVAATRLQFLTNLENTSFLFLVGAQDQTVLPIHCKTVAEDFAEKGIEAKAILFPGVYHGFDDVETKTVSTRYGVQVMRPDRDATQRSYDEATALLKRVF